MVPQNLLIIWNITFYTNSAVIYHDEVFTWQGPWEGGGQLIVVRMPLRVGNGLELNSAARIIPIPAHIRPSKVCLLGYFS